MTLNGFFVTVYPWLTVCGLGVDIIGAFVIALPDVPPLFKKLKGGRIREGKYQLESFALIGGTQAYDTILNELESLYDEHLDAEWRLNPEPHHITIEEGDVLGGEGKTLVAYTASDDEDDKERWEIGNIPYWTIELHLRRRIQYEESKIRAFGFGLLASGFAIQILGHLVT